MAEYFVYRGWKYEGFLVTEKIGNNENEEYVFIYDNITFDVSDGIILALGKRAFSEVYPNVQKKLDISQLLLPKYEES